MASYAVGFALLGVGIIGSWLVGSQSTTAAADSMPSLNSAVRGSAVFVSFGSNRISAQVVWTKNFKAVRQKSSGKGGSKGGGSGGLGSAKGGSSSSSSYLYYWDMMFNFGIMDVPSAITRGWVGSDPIDSANLDTITAGTASTKFQSFFSDLVSSTTTDAATLNFTEAFVSPGYGTDDPSLESWPYFEEQEGVQCAWPYTAYVGFNHLRLGETTTVPQLSFEFAGTHNEYNVSVSLDPNDIGGGTTLTNIWMRGEDGLNYRFVDSNGPHITLYPAIECVETGQIRQITNAMFQGMIAGLALNHTPLTDYNIAYILPVPNRPYFFLGTGTAYNHGSSSPGSWQMENPIVRCIIHSLYDIDLDAATLAFRADLTNLSNITECWRVYTNGSKYYVYLDGTWVDNTVLTLNITGDVCSTDWDANFSASGVESYADWHIVANRGVTDVVDCTPAYVIYRILTSDVFGFATQALFGYTITTDRIDFDSYTAAVDHCIDLGVVISVSYSNQDDLLTILNELVALYGGYLTEIGGKIVFGVVKEDDVPVRTIDNRHLVPSAKGQPPVTVTKGALEDGYNKIQFNYRDRSIDYKQNQVIVADEVDMDLNGPRVKTYPTRYTMSGTVATNVAVRALWQNLYGKDQYTFTLGWKDSDLCQGDVITLVDSFDDILKYGIKSRIVNWKEKKRGVFDVTAVREFASIIQATARYTQQTSIAGGYTGLIQAVEPMMRQVVYELPKEFQGSKSYVYFGYSAGSKLMGAQLYISQDGLNYVLTQDVQPFLVSGISATDMPMRPKGHVENGFEFYLFPTSLFNPATPTFVDTYTFDDITPAVRAAGGGVFVVGSEAIAVEGLTLLGQNHYRAKYAYRGWGGSPIGTHNSGDLFHHHAAGIFAHEITEDKIGTRLSFKIAPYNFAGQVYNIASIDASTYTIRGDYWLPRQQPTTRMYVPSALAWSASEAITGPYIGVASGGSDVILIWQNAYNDNGYGQGGFGAGGFGHNADTLDDVKWRVEVSSKNGTMVSSTIVTTGYFAYTLAQNSTDFGGFGRDLVVRVVPFNSKGDGPVDDVRSISMNW